MTTMKECVWDGLWMVVYTRVHNTPIGKALPIGKTGALDLSLWSRVRAPVRREVGKRLRQR